MLSHEDVRYGFEFILGRKPESESAYESHRKFNSLAALRAALLRSNEFTNMIMMIREQGFTLPRIKASVGEEIAIFIHVPKTAGSTLHHALATGYSPNQVARIGNMFGLSFGEVMSFRLISGHFDYATTELIPRPKIKRLAVFRDPFDRLLSMYADHKILHLMDGGTSPIVKLAQALPPEEFFLHPDVTNDPFVNNAYFRAFATSLADPIDDSNLDIRSKMKLGEKRIRSLDGVGLTRNLTKSIDILAKVIGISAPRHYRNINITDEKYSRVGDDVQRPRLTEELRQIMEPLVALDQTLYQVAEDAFGQQTKISRKSSASIS